MNNEPPSGSTPEREPGLQSKAMALPKLTLDELDNMSALERIDAIRSRVITDLSEVPEEVLARFHAKARRLAADGK